MFGFGVGLTNAVILRRFPSWQNIFRIITAPLFFLSAVFYSFDIPADAGARPTDLEPDSSTGSKWCVMDTIRDYRATGLDGDYLFACGLGLTVMAVGSVLRATVRQSDRLLLAGILCSRKHKPRKSDYG